MFHRSLLAALLIPVSILGTSIQAQVLDATPSRTIRTTKAEVVSLAVSPKGDQLLIGMNKGAELYDLESGKRIHAFPFNEDGGTAVYHVGFNENGEYVVLIGHSGKRTVWAVKTGKQEKVISDHRWVPDPRAVKAMGLDMKNSTFDRFYQQQEVKFADITARSGRHGIVEFLDADGKPKQKLEFPENKDQHHRSPLLVFDGQLLVGSDDGRVLFYTLP
jgi:WD40 repeat protein